VIAVEPHPGNASLLRANIVLNRVSERIEVVEGAISKENGNAQLAVSGTSSWGHYLVGNQSDVDGFETVQTMTLSSILRGRSPAVVKSNCEGGEFSLIPQLFALGLYPKVIICMVHGDMGDVSELRSQLLNNRYKIREFSADPSKPRWLCSL
jgi:FkbM family methyltransferase